MIFERSLASILFIALIVALNQFPALLGEKGLLPVTRFLEYVKFKQAPSLFHWKFSDTFFKFICWIGIILSLAIVCGLSRIIPLPLHILLWLFLYALYLSITNVGQIFYGFGWESMLCEATFLMAFMGPEWMSPSWIPLLSIRWMLFRTEMGAGLMKIRGDKCWKDLTALYYHHETQPMPNPLTRYFHHLPRSILRGGVVFSHFVQLVAPFGLFLPAPISSIAAGLIIFHQLVLIVGGNYAWLNWLTVVLAFVAFPLESNLTLEVRPIWFEVLLGTYALFILWQSYQPLLNLFAKRQKMNYCWNRYHLVGAYGAFGSITKKRYELIIEGSETGAEWLPYEFKAKPGDVTRTPAQFAPYHLRLDWLMWFLPFSVLVENGQVYVLEHEPWFIQFVHKLLQNDGPTIKLIRNNPFKVAPPTFIRVRYFQYELTALNSKEIWKRTFMGDYLPPMTLNQFIGE